MLIATKAVLNQILLSYDYTAKTLLTSMKIPSVSEQASLEINNELIGTAFNSNSTTRNPTSRLSQKNSGYGGNWKAQWNSN
jgi:hypothetical protein